MPKRSSKLRDNEGSKDEFGEAGDAIHTRSIITNEETSRDMIDGKTSTRLADGLLSLNINDLEKSMSVPEGT